MLLWAVRIVAIPEKQKLAGEMNTRISCCGAVQIPVGRATLGRIMNVIGEPIDEKGPLGTLACSYVAFHALLPACLAFPPC